MDINPNWHFSRYDNKNGRLFKIMACYSCTQRCEICVELRDYIENCVNENKKQKTEKIRESLKVN